MNRLLLAWLLAIPVSEAIGRDVTDVPVVKSESRRFAIPFQVASADQERYATLELWLSKDEGKTWECVDRAKPQGKRFNYSGQQNGMHWFTVRTIDKSGRKSPALEKDLTPSMKVLIHSKAHPQSEPTTSRSTPGPAVDVRVAAILARAKLASCGFAGLR